MCRIYVSFTFVVLYVCERESRRAVTRKGHVTPTTYYGTGRAGEVSASQREKAASPYQPTLVQARANSPALARFIKSLGNFEKSEKVSIGIHIPWLEQVRPHLKQNLRFLPWQ